MILDIASIFFNSHIYSHICMHIFELTFPKLGMQNKHCPRRNKNNIYVESYGQPAATISEEVLCMFH